MPRPPALSSRALALIALTGLLACGESASTPPAVEPARLDPGTREVHFGFGREEELELHNEGGRPVGPITLRTEPVRRADSSRVSDAELVVEPTEVPTLQAGSSVRIQLRVRVSAVLPAGGYSTGLRVESDLGLIHVPVDFAVREADAEDVASVSITEAPESVRQGAVAPVRVEVTDADGAVLDAAPLRWSTLPSDAARVEGSRFVAFRPGPLKLVATAGTEADTVETEVRPRGLSGSISFEAAAAAPGRITSDLWVHGDAAYTGTWLGRADASAPGNALFVWDVSDPSTPALADSVIVDARVVNDIKISDDGELGVLTHELSKDGENGITFLDLADPLHPEVVGRFTDGLEAGVHNVWLAGDHLYVVVDGVGNGLRILDVSDPARPEVVASYYAGSSFLHDVYVRDGLAFLSHWNAGLVILDVGNGVAGGSPTAPVEVSRINSLGPSVHNAWYWPEAGYVFVGQEIFGPFPSGDPPEVHVVDVRDLRHPEEVATISVSGETPHNFWLDEDEAVLYAAWYSRGVRAVDVSGELLGPLERQGRIIAGARFGETGPCPPVSSSGTCTWASQLHRGRLFLADMTEGLVVASPPR